MELNNVNCIILSGVLAITLLTYLVTGCIILALGGISSPESGYNIMCRCANSRPVHVVLQIIAFGALINGCVAQSTIPGSVLSSQSLGSYFNSEYTYSQISLLLAVLSLIYLIHSAFCVARWLLSDNYPQNCFSPTQLKNFLARVQSTEPNCSIQVSHSKMCPGVGNELSKEFAPHLWTEFTESIDVVGARKNRIESAQNISDVLEELLRKNKVCIVDINTCVLPEDEHSLTNTKYFIYKLIDSASTKFRKSISANFTVVMPTISGIEVKTPIKCDINFTKKELHNLTFDSLEEDHSYKKLQLGKLSGPKLTAIVHREMDLPIFWYIIWKYRDAIQIPCVLFPPLGTLLATVIELVVPRHTLDISMKYSYVPQTEAPYKLDRTSPDVDWTICEPEKVTVLMPSSRFLLPRDSLSKIVTGQMNWSAMDNASRKHLLRTCSTESSPPVLTPTPSTNPDPPLRTTSTGNTSHFRRSLSPFPSYHPCPNIFFPDGVISDGPPSYTAVFTDETENVTPPPHYSNIQSV